jgi:hypothetical protein
VKVWDICQSCGGARHRLLQHHDQRGQSGTRYELSPLFRAIARRWLQVPERRKRRLFDEWTPEDILLKLYFDWDCQGPNPVSRDRLV